MSRQVRKNLVALLAVGAVTAGLGFYAYYGVFKPDEAASAAKEVASQLVPGAKDSSGFEKLVVTSQGETTTLVRDGEHWKITAPVSAAADDGTVESLLSSIRTAKLEPVDEHPSAEALKKYGLEHPDFTVAVDHGGQTVTFSGGVVNSFDNSEYIARQGTTGVFLAPATLGDAARKKTFDLREKRVLPLASEEVKQIELSTGITLARDAQKRWTSVKPTAASADDEAVNALLAAVTQARATAFIADSEQARRDDGLTRPTIEATFTAGSGERVTLSIGASADHHAFALISRGAQTTLAEVPTSLPDALKKQPADFKDRTVLRFDDPQVAKASFTPTGGGEAITVERTRPGSEDWTVTAPKKAQAKQWSISTILWALHGLKAAQFGPTNPNAKELAKLGIDAKSQSVTLLDPKGATLATLQLGDAVTGQKGQVWARNGSGAVFAVDGSGLSSLPQSVDALLEQPAKTAAKQVSSPSAR